jgi:hypothetical protein
MILSTAGISELVGVGEEGVGRHGLAVEVIGGRE